MVPVRAGVYARISSDREGDGLGVGRQLEDCQQLAQLRGWAVVESYVDDDVSAYSGKARPQYARMLDDLRTGSINAVLVYHLDRLHRQPKELEEFFEVCKEAGVDDLATVTGRIDLADPDGDADVIAREVNAIIVHVELDLYAWVLSVKVRHAWDQPAHRH